MNKIRIAKNVTVAAGFAFCIYTIIVAERGRKNAVAELNTFTGMFGSLANFVGADVIDAWHDAFMNQEYGEVEETEATDPPWSVGRGAWSDDAADDILIDPVKPEESDASGEQAD